MAAEASGVTLRGPVPELREFPVEAVRDLIGILRALYAAERAKATPSPRRLAAIESLAEVLKRARRLAVDHDPGTAPHARAVAAVERALPRLADLTGLVDEVAPVLAAAGDRIRRGTGTRAAERDRRRASDKLRG